MELLKKHSSIALGYFFIIAILGVLLRLLYVTDTGINYRYIVHSHSHVALLGWVYTALTTLIYKIYLHKNTIQKKYRVIFWSTQITIIGMGITFPFTGYALFSILFSTLFLLTSYWFMWFFIKHTIPDQKKTFSYRCIRAALWYMIISSIGPWALGAIMSTLGSTSIWYKIAIYFYLHFQYNGWYMLALLGVFFYLLEHRNIIIPQAKQNALHITLHTGITLSFFLSVLWTTPHPVFYILGGIGAIVQLAAFLIFIGILQKIKQNLNQLITTFESFLLKIVLILLGLKMVLQVLSSLPYFVKLTYTVLDFVVAYLHLTFLGIVSLSILVFLQHLKLLKISNIGILIFLLGFFGSEILILYKGIVIWLNLPLFDNYYQVLLLISCLLPISIGYLLVYHIKNTRSHKKISEETI